jgi:hypothetical protein
MSDATFLTLEVLNTLCSEHETPPPLLKTKGQLYPRDNNRN